MKSWISQEDRTKWIPMSECKDGYFYYIHARNSSGGIYDASKHEFTISRFKFSDNFLFNEEHWDLGPPYGTVKPLREICKAPEFKNDEERLAWLNEETPKLPDPWEDWEDPEDPRARLVRWDHT